MLAADRSVRCGVFRARPGQCETTDGHSQSFAPARAVGTRRAAAAAAGARVAATSSRGDGLTR